MRTVFFDLLFSQPMDGTKFHGGGEYIKSIFRSLCVSFHDRVKIVVFYDTSNYIDGWIVDIINKYNVKVYDVQTASDIVRIFNDNHSLGDVFYTGMIYKYAGLHMCDDIKKIGVCHGLRPIECLYDKEEWRYLSSLHEWKEYLRNIIRKKHAVNGLRTYFSNIICQFDVVITDSYFSAYSIRTNLPGIFNSRNIKVYYAPLKYIDFSTASNSKCSNSECDYVLMISANRWLKNSARGIKAIDYLYSNRLLKQRTIIVGHLPKKVKSLIKNPEMFECIEYVSTEELESLYQGCKVFFYPTLNEGFGLPPMEAMKYYKTCVVSSVCSLPEIYGESVYYCNPYDENEMANRILYAVENQIDHTLIDRKFKEIETRQELDTYNQCLMICGLTT